MAWGENVAQQYGGMWNQDRGSIQIGGNEYWNEYELDKATGRVGGGGTSQADINAMVQNAMKEQGGGVPGYASILNEDLTAWKPGTISSPTSQYNTSYLNDLASYSGSTADSPWLQLMRTNLGGQSRYAQEQARQQGATAGLQGMDALASRRGLSTGAAERLGSQANLATMMEQQRIARDYTGKTQEATIEEARQKQALKQVLPQLEMQRAQYETGLQQSNLARLLEERARMHDYGMRKYEAEMTAQGASETAAAMQAQAENQGLLNGIFDIGSWF